MPQCFKTPLVVANVCKTEEKEKYEIRSESWNVELLCFCFVVWYEENAECFSWSMNCRYRKIGGYHARSWVQWKDEIEQEERKVESSVLVETPLA
jgi:hypothetical protein